MAVSKQTEQEIAEFQTMQNQLQMILLQKQQVKLQLDEVNNALSELKKTDGAIFRAVGTLLFESDKEGAEKALNEQVETLNMRTEVLGRQEDKLKKKLAELREKLEKELGIRGAGSGAA